MFYCDKCAKKNKWPEGFSRSYGPCEVCHRSALCSDLPSHLLPPERKRPKKRK